MFIMFESKPHVITLYNVIICYREKGARKLDKMTRTRVISIDQGQILLLSGSGYHIPQSNLRAMEKK